ncbi:hypothetical protein ET445_14075 [Agromyces protaetiae]|uniref:Uncharacterized protein n=1 Tax=Agromyces protaetiae TaxID=2509455 RepID=A0A4P6FEE5_9MICO|nr:hypothetical protein [Agromyces protaetiae]QAY74285.1 hypothetical protein ET445_14075 [Agromyces protaetiae]
MSYLPPFFFLGAIVWVLFVLALITAATFSILAAVRPKKPFVWIAAGSLGAAVLAAAALEGQSGFGTTPLVVLLGLTVAVFGGSAAAGTALDLAMGRSVTPGLHGGIIVTDRRIDAGVAPGVKGDERRREVLRGGLTIGVLERFAAAATIIAGFPEGLAIIIAVKGVGRFTELDAPEARERFIIGTFASLIWACAVGLAVRLAIA